MAQLGSDLDKLKQNAESMGRGKQGKGAADGGAGKLDDIPEEEMQFDDDEQKQMDGDLTTIKEEDGEELSGGVVFDLWLSDTELMEAAQRAEVSLGLERRDSLEAAMPTREEMIAKLEARRKK